MTRRGVEQRSLSHGISDMTDERKAGEITVITAAIIIILVMVAFWAPLKITLMLLLAWFLYRAGPWSPFSPEGKKNALHLAAYLAAIIGIMWLWPWLWPSGPIPPDVGRHVVQHP
jgi:hypothetical protein